MLLRASLEVWSSVFFRMVFRSRGYLVSLWCGLASMSASFRRLHCLFVSAHCNDIRFDDCIFTFHLLYFAILFYFRLIYRLFVWSQTPHRDVDLKDLIVSQQRAHVFHTALLLHTVADIRLEPGCKLYTQTRHF